MRITRLLLVVISLVLFAGACTSPKVAADPALLGQPPTTPQRAVQFPRGRLTAVTSPNIVVLAIENDGRFRIYVDNDLLDSGRFYAEGPHVLVDSIACGDRSIEPAAYNWLYDDENGLTFQPVDADPCVERQQYLSEQYQMQYLFIFNIPDRSASGEWLG